MSMGLLLQYAVVALAVMLSAAYVARSRFPAGVRRLRVSVALPLLRDGRARWLRTLGKVIAPLPRVGGNDACGGCNGCGPRSHPH